MNVNSRRLGFALRLILIIIAVTLALFPFFWMLRTSIVPPDEVYSLGLDVLPERVTIANYLRAWEDAHLGRAMLNGLIVTFGILLFQLLTVIPAAFAFAKLRFRGRNALFLAVVASLLVSSQVTAVPNYITLSAIGLVNTRLGLILPFATSAFGIFLIRQYLISTPPALLEAARMDGLSMFKTMLLIYIPVARPAIAAFAVFSFVVHWNDYLWPLLVARSAEIHTPALALAIFNNAEVGRDFGALTAGAAIVTIPAIIAFLLAQQNFVEGISGGEIPG
jgi:multiple sugar transport system permease protein